MKNSELRNLVAAAPKKPAKSRNSKKGDSSGGAGGLVVQGVLAFVVAIGGISLYRNPSLAQGWIPGLGGKPAAVAKLATGAPLPAGAAIALADEKAQPQGDPLNMMDEQMTASFQLAGTMMAPDATAQEQAELSRGMAAVSAQNTGLMKVVVAGMGRTNLMGANLYLGGKTSHKMVETCKKEGEFTTRLFNDNAEAKAQFVNCYLTVNVGRLCAGSQRKVLADVLDNYFATRAELIKRAEDAAHGQGRLDRNQPKPADWSNPTAKAMVANLAKLVAQGYVSRADFGWFPDEEIKPILNGVAVEAEPCGDQKT